MAKPAILPPAAAGGRIDAYNRGGFFPPFFCQEPERKTSLFQRGWQTGPADAGSGYSPQPDEILFFPGSPRLGANPVI